MERYEQLTSHNLTNEQVQKLIGADSLEYITHEGMMQVVKESAKDNNGHCSACFNGVYPLKIDEW